MESTLVKTQAAETVKNRIRFFDIAKGIGIFFVVYAHASAPFSAYINKFHMPLFFLISGLLYNTKSGLKEYSIKKIKSLYIPFVFWNILVLLVKMIVTKDVVLYFKSIIKVFLTLNKDGQFFGATWFLGALFTVSVLYKFIDVKIPQLKCKPFIILGIFTFILIIGFVITLPYLLSRTFILSFYFAVGALIKNVSEHLKKFDTFWVMMVCLLFFIVTGDLNLVHMGNNTYSSPLLFIMGSFMASYAVIYISRLLDKTKIKIFHLTGKCFEFLGKHSLDIVIWHFIFFRIVIILEMMLNKEKLSVTNILKYYPTYPYDSYWWILYTVIGIVLPIAWCGLLRMKPWGKIFKKMHIV
ncbi:MAG: acyltransferase family protein [Porcipelethomonas sp.]